MAFKIILLVLPALAFARIDVEVSGRVDPDSKMNVYFSGSQVDVISDLERESFDIKDSNLKNAVKAYFGKRPDDAFLRSPTPWGDLYQTYNWGQVLRSLKPVSGKILKITTHPQIVMEQIFENNSSKPGTFNVGISQAVENRVSSSWSKGQELSMEQPIKYEFDIGVMTGGGATSMSYTSLWGYNAEKSDSVTVGSTSAMEMLLQPGQSVEAQLHATRGTIQMEIEYEASLSGAVAVNYDESYKGHHFWALDVQEVMSSLNMENKLKSKEVIEIGFYTNAKVVVHDRNMGTKMIEVAL